MKRFLLGFVTAVLIGGGYLYSPGQLVLPWAGEQKDQAPAQQAHAHSAQAGPPVEAAVYTVKPFPVDGYIGGLAIAFRRLSFTD